MALAPFEDSTARADDQDVVVDDGGDAWVADAASAEVGTAPGAVLDLDADDGCLGDDAHADGVADALEVAGHDAAPEDRTEMGRDRNSPGPKSPPFRGDSVPCRSGPVFGPFSVPHFGPLRGP